MKNAFLGIKRRLLHTNTEGAHFCINLVKKIFRTPKNQFWVYDEGANLLIKKRSSL